VKEGVAMYAMGYLPALLAAIAVGWAVPLVGVALVLPLLQVVFVLNPWVAAGLMGLLGGLLVWYSIYRQAWWQAILWGVLWGLGVLTAIAGVFQWYALFIEGVVLVVLLVPGVVVPAWAGLLRWYAVGELALTLVLVGGQGAGLPGVTLVIALLLVALAALLGLGAYRPFETRRLRRRFATMATLAAAAFILWQPVLVPASQWLGDTAEEIVQAVAASPIGRLYRVVSLRAERKELGERVKTESLRQLQPDLTRAHKSRWERGISQIPNLPLAPGEWGDLGIPRKADP
jgi:hypothetical protein